MMASAVVAPIRLDELGCRPVHWVFKVGNLKKTMDFYSGLLDMRIHRHEEFETGCEATCNGPYAGAWSKTMIGYRGEAEACALEITYNYGIEGYERGNDYRHIGLAVDLPAVLAKARAAGVAVEECKEGAFIADPDGAKFLLVHQPGREEPFLFVSLNVSNLAASADFYRRVFGMKDIPDVPGATGGDSVMLGYSPSCVCVELVQSPGGAAIDFKKAKGRLATETSVVGAQHEMALRVKSAGVGQILHGPLTLSPHGEEVVIIEDPDGYEYCFVGAEGYKNCIAVKTKAVDWEYRKSKGGDGNPVPRLEIKGPMNAVVAVKNDDDFEAKIAEAGSRPVVVDCMASWCKKCHAIFPTFSALSAEHAAPLFLKMDIDECDLIAQDHSVLKVPTFLFVKSGKVVGRWEGSDPAALSEAVGKFVADA